MKACSSLTTSHNLLIALVLTLCLSNFVYAADDVQLDFDKSSLADLSKVVLKEILQKDFVLSDAVLKDARQLTISIQANNKNKLLPVFTQLMASHGFDVDTKNGVFFVNPLEKKPDAPALDEKLFTYTPKFRDVNYLLRTINDVFQDAKFTRPINQNLANQAQTFQPDHLLFRGTDPQLKSLDEVLNAVDVKENQVQINAYLYEVSLSDRSQSAFSLALNLLGSALKMNFAAQALSNVLTLNTGNVTAAFSALNSDSRFNSITSPVLLVKHGQRGKISVGADVPVLSAVSFQQNGQPVQSIEYRPSGVILDILPRFHQDNIELTINHQLSSFVQTVNGVNNSPTLIKREFNTVVNAQHNDLIIIGGLTEKRTTKTRAGVPLLPFLNTSRNSENADSEIVLLLHVTKI